MTMSLADQQVEFSGNDLDRVRPYPGGLYARRIKRWMDVTLVVLSSPITVPVIVVLAVLIFLRDGANPFYAQLRIGRRGRMFRLWKLRSMVPDAEAVLEDYLTRCADMRREWDEKQKLHHDPRVTSIGRLIRRTSLDELPQLWNVLIGEMSLVGPRPMLPSQRALYPGWAYYSLRPGLTGPWQVSDRNACSFSSRAAFDQGYYQKLSIAEDARLIAATFAVVTRGTGC